MANPLYKNGQRATIGDLVRGVEGGVDMVGFVNNFTDASRNGFTILRLATISGAPGAMMLVPGAAAVWVQAENFDRMIPEPRRDPTPVTPTTAPAPDPGRKALLRKIREDNLERIKQRKQLQSVNSEALMRIDALQGQPVNYFQNDCAIEQIEELLGIVEDQ